VKVAFKGSFTKDLKTIKDKDLLQKVKDVIEQVERAQDLREVSNLKHLKGGSYYRIRIGDYRLGLLVKDGTVSVVRFLHRKEIYRYFP
jgi:mRNA interferase RelE/StbE